MIFVITWEQFVRQEYLMKAQVFVKEDEDYWDVYTIQGSAVIKCRVAKTNSEADIMFVQRWFNDRPNVMKVVDVEDEMSVDPVPQVEDSNSLGGTNNSQEIPEGEADVKE